MAGEDESRETDAAEKPSRRVWSSRRKRIEGKTQYVRVSMSEFERAKLLQLEAQTGLSPSAILVDAALGTGDPASLQLRKQELVTLLEIRYLIATAANNINQVARHQNTTGEMASNGRAVVKEAREVMAKIVDVIEELKP
ncbi:plasmid mobilization relaxosome protein MobC [Arthrobacter sp. EH-1B-1]|uniref:Plasmid mobilization relaxosome protein MobC n=1 Tax=Arthrobacter vasquezii TaxID=2977629 RepID=A0ABT6CTQ7_9MICC|nr:plasmid mobilization relaxosome protein MobC [Arthrobacter vasquezii]MDF9277418.1 plasmid mobilization relaxosome protein MobC [Arthrobacter vasquezii]